MPPSNVSFTDTIRSCDDVVTQFGFAKLEKLTLNSNPRHTAAPRRPEETRRGVTQLSDPLLRDLRVEFLTEQSFDAEHDICSTLSAH